MMCVPSGSFRLDARDWRRRGSEACETTPARRSPLMSGVRLLPLLSLERSAKMEAHELHLNSVTAFWPINEAMRLEVIVRRRYQLQISSNNLFGKGAQGFRWSSYLP